MSKSQVIGVAGGGVTIAMLLAVFIANGGMLEDAAYCKLTGEVAVFGDGFSTDMSIGYLDKNSNEYIECSYNGIKSTWVLCTPEDPVCVEPKAVACANVVGNGGELWCVG